MLHIRIYKYNTAMFDHRRTQVFLLQVLGLRSLGLPSFLHLQRSGDTIHGRDRHISPTNLSKNVATGATGTTWVIICWSDFT